MTRVRTVRVRFRDQSSTPDGFHLSERRSPSLLCSALALTTASASQVDTLVDELFVAYFQEARDVCDPAVLCQVPRSGARTAAGRLRSRRRCLEDPPNAATHYAKRQKGYQKRPKCSTMPGTRNALIIHYSKPLQQYPNMMVGTSFESPFTRGTLVLKESRVASPRVLRGQSSQESSRLFLARERSQSRDF